MLEKLSNTQKVLILLGFLIIGGLIGYFWDNISQLWSSDETPNSTDRGRITSSSVSNENTILNNLDTQLKSFTTASASNKALAVQYVNTANAKLKQIGSLVSVKLDQTYTGPKDVTTLNKKCAENCTEAGCAGYKSFWYIIGRSCNCRHCPGDN